MSAAGSLGISKQILSGNKTRFTSVIMMCESLQLLQPALSIVASRQPCIITNESVRLTLLDFSFWARLATLMTAPPCQM